MRSTHAISYWAGLVVCALALTLGARAYAESPREELAHSYRLIKMSNHDYGGHRDAALKELQIAGDALGLDLKGKGDERESQMKSDEQMAEASRLLRAARDKLEAQDRERVARHVDRAVEEVDAALRVR
jgi:hypothetical protein